MLSKRVENALKERAPVVALETAVLTHGLPRPVNLEAFLGLHEAVLREGGVPAAVGLVDGAVRVGLEPAEARRLGAAEGVLKLGLADLPAAAAKGLSGGTTVGATLWAARRAGIGVFATGGIGGVHRGAAETFDVSGDLMALSRWGGCVVCSGAKAVLDLPKTFELLETLGVCVVGYRTGTFPAFTCRDSGIGLAHRAETPAEVVEILRARDALGLPGAVLVANPPPQDLALPRSEIEEALAAAGETAAGKEATPHLLEVVARRTGGRSVRTNVALLEANATLAAQIARELLRGPE